MRPAGGPSPYDDQVRATRRDTGISADRFFEIKKHPTPPPRPNMAEAEIDLDDIIARLVEGACPDPACRAGGRGAAA